MGLSQINMPGRRERKPGALEKIAMGVDIASKVLGTGLEAYKTFGPERDKTAADVKESESRAKYYDAQSSSAGKLSEKDKYEIEKDLKKRYDDEAKEFEGIHQNVKAISDTYEGQDLDSPGDPGRDLTLVKLFERLLDPKGVVRESDVNLIKSNAPLMDEVKRLYNKETGTLTGSLPPSLRKSVLAQVGRLYNSRKQTFDLLQDGMKAEADARGVNWDYIQRKLVGIPSLISEKKKIIKPTAKPQNNPSIDPLEQERIRRGITIE